MKNSIKFSTAFILLFLLSFSVNSSAQCPTSHTLENNVPDSIDIIFDNVPFESETVFIDTSGTGVYAWLGVLVDINTFRFENTNSNPFIHEMEFNSLTGNIICVYNTSLPVELISFSGSLNDLEQVVLKWSTATEKNNNGFEILQNGKAKGFVDGNGNSTLINHYSFILAPVNGYNYFQLNQIDNDGKNQLSGVIVVEYLKLPHGLSRFSFDYMGRTQNGKYDSLLNFRFSNKSKTVIIKQ